MTDKLEEVRGKPWNVLPINDLREHEESKDCWCNPQEDEGVIIHNAMDKREEYETGQRKYN